MLITLTALTVATAAPVARSEAAAPVSATPPAARQAAAAPRKPTNYCLTGDLTGSRIPQTECHTRAEWLARGVDPTRPE